MWLFFKVTVTYLLVTVKYIPIYQLRLVGDKEISLENRLDIIDELFQENLNLDVNGGVDYAHEVSS